MKKPSRKKVLDQKKLQKVKTRTATLEQTESVIAAGVEDEDAAATAEGVAAEDAVAEDVAADAPEAEDVADAPVAEEDNDATDTPMSEADAETSVPVANADVAAAVEAAESIAEVGVLTDRVPADETGTTTADAPVVEKSAMTESVATIAENMTTADVERLLQKIKMEITFSDDSTIEKEVLISGNENREKKNMPASPEDSKMPWGTVAILSIIVCASLITGIYHWITSYVQPSDPVQPAYIADDAGDALADDPAMITDSATDEPDEPETPETTRPRIEPPPEFAILWEEHGNEDIVAVLTLGETEFTVVQSDDNAFYITHDINREPSSQGWVFLDHQVNLLMGLDHNMVIYDPVGGIMREAVQEYAEYDFFLKFPTISFSTIYGDMEWEIFSYYVAPSEFPFDIVNPPDDGDWGDIVDQFTLATSYNTRLSVNMDDQILTIVVPTGIDPELFYILQARMLRQITS